MRWLRPFPLAKGQWLFAAGVCLLLLGLRAHFCLCLVKGESMLPGLRSGDLLLVDRLAYRMAAPQRGDVVVARDRADLIVKRVVGLPGDEVELDRGRLYVNGRPLAEAYPVQPGALSLGKGRLFEDRYALLGDNRSLPVSLTVHAVVSKEQIVGKVVATLRFWPIGRQQPLNETT